MSEQWETVYSTEAQIYEDFSRYEDEDNLALNRLFGLADFNRKTILEVGCGSGKYTRQVASRAGKYYALDRSKPLLEMAKAKSQDLRNLEYINANMIHIPLRDNSVDALFASWAFPPYDVEEESYSEVKRVLKDRGEIWLINNWPEGEFMDLREEAARQGEWEFIEWFMTKGIEVVEVVDSNFAFPNSEHAKRVLGFIFGQKAIRYLEQHPNAKIGHRIAIYHGRVR